MSIFNKIQLKRPKRSTFDLSYDVKLSLKMGKLTPVHIQECVPGDTFRMSSEAMFRMMPMIAPIMHKVDIYQHYFFVPNRILWPNWEKFITGGQPIDGSLPVPPAFPTLFGKDREYVFNASSLGDYLGLPTGVQLGAPVSALPFAAYQKVWQEYYRDQNLQSQFVDITLQDGQQDQILQDELIKLRDRAWEHDYFTSCLPFAQKGEAVDIPFDLQGDLDVKARSASDPDFGYPIIRDGLDMGALGTLETGVIPDGQLQVNTGSSTDAVYLDPNGSLYIDEDDVRATTTINDLRTAFSLQKWLEKNARGGSRYVESILAHFGIRSQDSRLQRPEYLGGSRSTMAISEVLQTAPPAGEDSTPQANMAGHGISVNGGKDFKYTCKEHGYIIGVLSIRPKTAYFQGVPRHFNKFDRTLYYWPDFAFLGEQEVLNKELFFTDDPDYDNATFGYIPRYSEYRYNPSRVSGAMRTSLDHWHMARKFDPLNPPTLSEEFIVCDPTKRIFAVEDDLDDEIVGHIFHKIVATRPMPKYGNPGGV